MTISEEISLEDFPAWSGARNTLDTLIEFGKCDEVEAALVDFKGGEPMDKTELNDILWFEEEWVLGDLAGLYQNEHTGEWSDEPFDDDEDENDGDEE